MQVPSPKNLLWNYGSFTSHSDLRTQPTDSLEPIRQQLHQFGYFYAPNLPATFDWIRWSQRLTQGKLMPQDTGEYLYDVKSLPKFAHRSDSKSQQALRYHTENPWIPNLVRYVVLWCLCQAENPLEGFTLIADGLDLLRWATTQAEQEHLLTTPYPFHDKYGQQRVYAPILSVEPSGQVQIRFSYNCLLYSNPSPDVDAPKTTDDELLIGLCDRWVEFANSHHTAVRMQPHSLLIIDNQRCLHARTAYSDPNRHLQRIWLG